MLSPPIKSASYLISKILETRRPRSDQGPPRPNPAFSSHRQAPSGFGVIVSQFVIGWSASSRLSRPLHESSATTLRPNRLQSTLANDRVRPSRRPLQYAEQGRRRSSTLSLRVTTSSLERSSTFSRSGPVVDSCFTRFRTAVLICKGGAEGERSNLAERSKARKQPG